MKRLAVVAASVAVLAGAGAGAASAGEVKGPPNQTNNTNETGALDHANSACAASGLNDFDLSDPNGQLVSQVQTAADSWKYYGLPKRSPRQARTVQGRNWGEVRLALAPAFRRGQAAPTRGAEHHRLAQQPSDPARRAARCRWPSSAARDNASIPGRRSPRNKGQRYPADPPTVQEIVAVMRHAGDGRHRARRPRLIVVP